MEVSHPIKIELSESTPLTYDEAIVIEKKIFEKEKEKYLSEFEGKYIALLNGSLLDSDSDFSTLAKRVYASHGYDKAIYITKVMRHQIKHRLATPKFK